MDETLKTLQRKSKWREAAITEAIRERIVSWCEGARLDAGNGRILQTRIESFSRDFGTKALGNDMRGWECGLAQILDVSNPKICRYLPYILPAYMYNFRRPYTCLVEKHDPIKEFCSELNKKRQKGEYLNFSNDEFLGIKEMEGKPLLFFEKMLPKVKYGKSVKPSEEPKEHKSARATYARRFVLPKMKASEVMMLSVCAPDIDIKKDNRIALSYSAVDIADWFLGWYYTCTHSSIGIKIDWVWSFLLLYRRLYGIKDELWVDKDSWEELFSDALHEINEEKPQMEDLSRKIKAELEDKYYMMKLRLKQEKEILNLSKMSQKEYEGKIAEMKSAIARQNPSINECEEDDV